MTAAWPSAADACLHIIAGSLRALSVAGSTSHRTTQPEVRTEARPRTVRPPVRGQAAPLTRTLQTSGCPRLLRTLTCGYDSRRFKRLLGVRRGRTVATSGEFQILLSYLSRDIAESSHPHLLRVVGPGRILRSPQHEDRRVSQRNIERTGRQWRHCWRHRRRRWRLNDCRGGGRHRWRNRHW